MAARKETLAAQWEQAATKAVDQINNHLDRSMLPPNLLVPIAGVATDKLLALRGDPQQLQVQVQVEPGQRLYDKLNELAQELKANAAKALKDKQACQVVESTPSRAALSNGEIVPDSGAETGPTLEQQTR